MKQYRITSENIIQNDSTDCYLAPDDIAHALKASSCLGGLGGAEALANYQAANKPMYAPDDRGRIARENNIQPGTDEWFRHWFGNPPKT